MRLHRFIGDYDLSKNIAQIKNPENIKQIKGVLRLGIGDQLILCDGKGTESKVKIEEIDKNLISVKLLDKRVENPGKTKVTLFLAILKKENFELAIQKGIECGANEIVPVITERTVKTGLNIERLKKIILEAAEQSGQTYLPTLSEVMNFEEALKDGLKNKDRIIFDLNAKENFKNKNESISIFVGPEGGFTETEIKKAIELGYQNISLGPLTLRAETAAIIGTYLASN